MENLLARFTDMGLEFTIGDGSLRVAADGRLRSIDVPTLPYPGIATDYKPLIITMLSVADGAGIVTENLYPGRFRYVEELNRLGANIRTTGHHAVVRGVPRLSGRAGAGPRHPGRGGDGGRRARRRGRDHDQRRAATSTAATTTSSAGSPPSAPASNGSDRRRRQRRAARSPLPARRSHSGPATTAVGATHEQLLAQPQQPPTNATPPAAISSHPPWWASTAQR